MIPEDAKKGTRQSETQHSLDRNIKGPIAAVNYLSVFALRLGH